jgi:UDP-N-acetylglucosamine 2-epimerase (non-hydrolysing)
MLDQALRIFGLRPDHDLGVMQADQRPGEVASSVLARATAVLEETKPGIVVVQGDTTSTMAAALAAFFSRIPVAHVEAGLRTGDRWSPYPEELMRRIVTQIATLHFAPTAHAARKLRFDHADVEGSVFLTGNTVVDAIQWILARRERRPKGAVDGRRAILLTAHRRENFGEPMERIFRAVRRIADVNADVVITYPVHLNPRVQEPARRILGGHERIRLIDPVDYPELISLLDDATLVLTDSGGIQEEAPVLGKPTLVLRDDTERPEAIEAGTAVLVGTDEDRIAGVAQRLLDDPREYARMAHAGSPFGDGHAAVRIADVLEAWHLGRELPHRFDEARMAPQSAAPAGAR